MPVLCQCRSTSMSVCGRTKLSLDDCKQFVSVCLFGLFARYRTRRTFDRAQAYDHVPASTDADRRIEPDCRGDVAPDGRGRDAFRALRIRILGWDRTEPRDCGHSGGTRGGVSNPGCNHGVIRRGGGARGHSGGGESGGPSRSSSPSRSCVNPRVMGFKAKNKE